MARPKSLLPRLQIDTALKAHRCQHNSNHQILKGEKRLKVSVGRTDEHFCKECALRIIKYDIDKLTKFAAGFDKSAPDN
jgi:hypothetical protein